MQAEPLFALAVIFILIFPGTCAGAIKKRNHLGDSAGMVRIRRMICKRQIRMCSEIFRVFL